LKSAAFREKEIEASLSRLINVTMRYAASSYPIDFTVARSGDC